MLAPGPGSRVGRVEGNQTGPPRPAADPAPRERAARAFACHRRPIRTGRVSGTARRRLRPQAAPGTLPGGDEARGERVPEQDQELPGERPGEGRWLPVEAAARATGVAPKTVRDWIRSGRVR